MSWVKLDDRIFDNPKIAVLSAEAKVAYLKSITYCARELTDGRIPRPIAHEYAGKPKVVRELVPALWETPDTLTYGVHDYLKYNPTRAQVEAERSAARRRMNGRTSPEVSPEVQGELHPPPVYPDPRNSESLSPVPPFPTPADPGPSGGGRMDELRRKWDSSIGSLSTRDAAEFAEFASVVPHEWFLEAIAETDEKSDTSPWPFCRSILTRCIEVGKSPKGKREKHATEGSARAQFLARFKEAEMAHGEGR